MNKLMKIMAMALSGLIMFSQVAFAENTQTADRVNDDIPYVILVSEGFARGSVQFDGSKKKETIEVNLEQDMWYGWYLGNQTENKVYITEIGVNDDVSPESWFAEGISGGVYSKKDSDILKKGKYTFVIESLGENNLKGFFEYVFSSNAPEETLETLDNEAMEAMYELQKYGIIEGDPDGELRPYSAITRAEMAKVLCKVLVLPELNNGKSAFSDMSLDHWAYGYIETAYSLGLVDGNDDGTFAPDNDVKFSEAIKMIVTALGYKPLAEETGGFPHGYVQIASENGITKDIDHVLDVPCNRSIVFKMLHNALDVPFLLQTGFGAKTEYKVADGNNGTAYQALRPLITGSETIPEQKYDNEYFDELNKFAESGEYHDKIAAELEEFWKPEDFNGTYTFQVVFAELNSDATQISLKIKVIPDNGEICYVHLGYTKVDGEWEF